MGSQFPRVAIFASFTFLILVSGNSNLYLIRIIGFDLIALMKIYVSWGCGYISMSCLVALVWLFIVSKMLLLSSDF